jgi:hypothetical protein
MDKVLKPSAYEYYIKLAQKTQNTDLFRICNAYVKLPISMICMPILCL